MSAHRRRQSPQGQHVVSALPGRREDKSERPFPTRAVCHRRPFNPRTQDSLDLNVFERITIAEQAKDNQEHHSNDTKETTAPQHPRDDSHRLPRGELQMTREIQAKELKLQEKLLRVEEKLRKQNQRGSTSSAVQDDRRREEEKPNRGPTERGKTLSNTRQSDSKDRIMHGRRRENVTQLTERRDQRDEDRIRKTHEEKEGAKVTQSRQLERKGRRGTYEITVQREDVKELRKSRWENVKGQTRGKVGDVKDNGTFGEAGMNLKERQYGTISKGGKGHTTEEKHRVNASDDEPHNPGTSQHKTSEAENQTNPGKKLSGDSLLSVSVFLPSRPQQEEVGSDLSSVPLLPCKVCNRKFAKPERLQVHVQICKKLKNSHRSVFNSYVNRTKGCALEEYLKSQGRPLSPEVGNNWPLCKTVICKHSSLLKVYNVLYLKRGAVCLF